MKIRQCKNCGISKFIICFSPRKRTCLSCRKEKRSLKRLVGKRFDATQKRVVNLRGE